ncbi:MAG: histidine kinase [Bacteroidota bacterium]
MTHRPPPPPWPRTTEAALIVGFWAVLGALALVRLQLSPRGAAGASGATGPFVVTLVEYGAWAALTPFVFALTRRVPFVEGERLRRGLLYLVVALAAAIAVEWLRQTVFLAFFPDDFVRRGFRFGRRGGPPPDPTVGILTRLRFLDEFVIAVAVLVAGFARDALIRLRAREADAAHLEAQLADARLAALRMQLNPHFLFNTLHAVSALVERDPAGVRTMIARLSALLRRVLDGSDRHEVPLRDELALVRDYLAIQSVRLGDRLEIVTDIADETLDALVPALVLQPLAENAVQHGIAGVEGPGTLTISARRESARLVVEVRDTGPGPSDAPSSSSGVGLRNTRERLATLYGETAALTLERGPTGGAIARVMLPFHTADDLVLHG